ncbi:MAG: rRNA pseudouridine synthase [Deltaproteobacteria bacterium]|jgi:23S rRNA pseudouridine2605 synthase|nr:rRNA pseudouridine synthase [Deltaproteobacteria bacterium]MBW2537686.1 rRNA pseudouridine synthase [Deltaproteobacteria bacterium]
MARQRLQKIIAQAGIASRRAAEELIVAGRVRVNGRVVTTLGTSADDRRDRIEVDGNRLSAEAQTYVVLHKPRSFVSTLDDPEGRPTVAELVRDAPVRLFPVGRLDFGTSGVLLFTNDGAFADALLRPRRGVPKTYVAKLDRRPGDDVLERWRAGVELDDGPTLPAEVRRLGDGERSRAWIEITLRQGKNRQIHRMAEAVGLRVMRLVRVAFAGIRCDDLRPGRWRPLTVDELRLLRKQYGVPKRIRSGGGGRAATAGRSGRPGTKPRAAGRRAARGRGRGRR